MNPEQVIEGRVKEAIAECLTEDGKCRHCGNDHEWDKLVGAVTDLSQLQDLRQRALRGDKLCIAESKVAIAVLRQGRLSAGQIKTKTKKPAAPTMSLDELMKEV